MVLSEQVPAAAQWHVVNELQQQASVVIARPAGDLYEMISDVTRMGEWSPVCTGCWWDDGGGPQVGAWFTGRNEIPGRTWETRSQVVVAEPGRAFAFCVGGDRVRWGYEFEPVEGGTEVTETWEFLPAGLAFFEERFGPEAGTQVAERAEAARTGMPTTLEALKRAAEGA